MSVIYYLMTCRNNASPVGKFGGRHCTCGSKAWRCKSRCSRAASTTATTWRNYDESSWYRWHSMTRLTRRLERPRNYRNTYPPPPPKNWPELHMVAEPALNYQQEHHNHATTISINHHHKVLHRRISAQQPTHPTPAQSTAAPTMPWSLLTLAWLPRRLTSGNPSYASNYKHNTT